MCRIHTNVHQNAAWGVNPSFFIKTKLSAYCYVKGATKNYLENKKKRG